MERSAFSPSFRRLAASNLFAQLAEQVALAAAPMLAVLALGAGVAGAGWLQAAQTLPFLLVAIPAGLMADRLPRRLLLVAAEALRTASLALVLVLAITGMLDLPMLAVLGFLGACGTVVYTVVAPALVPSIVAPQALVRANARLEVCRTLAFVSGPVLAGVLAGQVGAGWAFALAALLSACAALLLSGLPAARPQARDMHDVRRELAEGMRFVARHDLLRPIFATQFIFAVAFFMLQAVYVPYAAEHLALGAQGIGNTLAAYGAGMLAGAILAWPVMHSVRFGTLIAIGPVSAAAASLVLLATVWAPHAWLAGAAFFVMGAGPILWVIATGTLRQAVTPAALLGRVSAINVLAYSARPLGAAIGASVGGALGAPACLALSAAAFLAQAIVILCSRAVRLERQPRPA